MRELIFFFSLIFIMISCKKDQEDSRVTRSELKFKKEGELKVFKSDSTLIWNGDIEIADNDYERETGLMYRKEIPENEAMLFVFPNEQLRYFYMKNTAVSLDIIYLDKQLRVVSIKSGTEPFNENSLPSEKPAQYVLEVRAGLCERKNIEPGDYIAFERL